MLVKEALAATFDRTESLTTNGSFTADCVVNDSGLYTRANKEALRRGAMERGTAVVPEQIETTADRWVKRGEDRADMMREVLCPRARGPG